MTNVLSDGNARSRNHVVFDETYMAPLKVIQSPSFPANTDMAQIERMASFILLRCLGVWVLGGQQRGTWYSSLYLQPDLPARQRLDRSPHLSVP